jgi:hypothetical protein
MRVVAESWYDMPVQVGRHVAQAGKIDLVRLHQFSNRRFNREYNPDEVRAVAFRKIGHFPDMSVPDHPAKPRIIRFVHSHDATPFVAPEQLASDAIA